MKMVKKRSGKAAKAKVSGLQKKPVKESNYTSLLSKICEKYIETLKSFKFGKCGEKETKNEGKCLIDENIECSPGDSREDIIPCLNKGWNRVCTSHCNKDGKCVSSPGGAPCNYFGNKGVCGAARTPKEGKCITS